MRMLGTSDLRFVMMRVDSKQNALPSLSRNLFTEIIWLLRKLDILTISRLFSPALFTYISCFAENSS